MTVIDEYKDFFYNKTYISNTEKIIKQKINSNIDLNFIQLSKSFNVILNDSPNCFWLKDIYNESLTVLENLYSKGSVIITNKIFEFFLIGTNAYTQITETIKDLSPINDSDIIKNRQYRLPTFTSLLEGCIANIFRFICNIADQVLNKKYSLQTNLASLCTAVKTIGYINTVNNINVNYRNAINHGRVLFYKDGKEIELIWKNSNTTNNEKITCYDFDTLINKVYDTASALILSIYVFLNNHPNILKINYQKRDYCTFNYLSMLLSNEFTKCEYISEICNKKQLNITYTIDILEIKSIFKYSLSMALLAYTYYDDYSKYLISFKNEKMAPGWIIITNEQIHDFINKKINETSLLSILLNSNNFIYFTPQSLNIDLQEIKYFRFPNYIEKEFSIFEISDVSTPDLKRLKCNMFIPNLISKNNIITLINKAISWVSTLKNVDSPTFHHKNGTMEADCIYINVYKNYSRGNREISNDNDNFICMVDYNKNGKTTLLHGGILLSVWNSLYKEKYDKVQFAWKKNNYGQRICKKIPMNSPCICGSGIKYKYCCGKKY